MFFVVEVDDDEEAGAVEAADGVFEELRAGVGDGAGGGVHDEFWGDAEADVGQAHGAHEGGFAVVDVVGEVFVGFGFGVAEPEGDVGAFGEAVEADLGDGVEGGRGGGVEGAFLSTQATAIQG